MRTSLVGISCTVLILAIGLCWFSEVQAMSVLDGINLQSTQSQAGQNQNSTQNRPNQSSEENAGQYIPKPQRNKMEESRGKKNPKGL